MKAQQVSTKMKSKATEYVKEYHQRQKRQQVTLRPPVELWAAFEKAAKSQDLSANEMAEIAFNMMIEGVKK